MSYAFVLSGVAACGTSEGTHGARDPDYGRDGAADAAPEGTGGAGTGGGTASGGVAGGSSGGTAGDSSTGSPDAGGDASSTGGSAGDAGTDSGAPGSNSFVDVLDVANQSRPAKVDLLFMVDNSISMADKQVVLKDTVPDLVRRLVNPNCVDASGKVQSPPSSSSAPCPAGFEREFEPLTDIHIGVITSSVGGHGSDACKGGEATLRDEEENDHGYLIGTRPRFATEAAKAPGTFQPLDPAGFLDWNPAQRGGTQDPAPFGVAFQMMVSAAGEFGCGFESQLEAIYRFLSDPQPYLSIRTDNCPGSQNPCAYKQGIDLDLLRQRKAFLRPDSAVAVMLISDENDCSIQDTQQAYYAARDEIFLPRARAICATNPNDRCCVSCVSPLPAGCAEDPTCTTQPTTTKDSDQPNLRCFNQKRRFGFDFLYPTKRYINALHEPTLCTSHTDLSFDANSPASCPDADGDGKPDVFANPLYIAVDGSSATPRPSGRVYLAGVVGVPWQDLKATTTENGKPYPAAELHYKRSKQLLADDVWAKILGEPTPPNGATPIPPTNMLMVESTAPRTGSDGQGNPLAPPTANALANLVNSHEWGNTNRDDLMYSCLFRTPVRDCAQIATLPDPQPGCDCKRLIPGDDNPLCQNPQTNAYETNQYFGKAYPSLRELEVLRGLGDNAVVSSICARNVTTPAGQDYGYRPAMDALVERMSQEFGAKCLPRKLTLDSKGHVPCSVVEAVSAGSACDAARGRLAVSSDVAASVRTRLASLGVCDVTGAPSCDSFTLCELQEAGAECHQNTDTQPKAGYCYVDPSQNPKDDPALVEQCPVNGQRLLRFVDPQKATPAKGAITLLACE